MTRPRVPSDKSDDCLEEILDYLMQVPTDRVTSAELRDEVLRIAGEFE